jgi:hypothetical protein
VFPGPLAVATFVGPLPPAPVTDYFRRPFTRFAGNPAITTLIGAGEMYLSVTVRAGIPSMTGALSTVVGRDIFLDCLESRLLEFRRALVFGEPCFEVSSAQALVFVSLQRECSRDETVPTLDRLLSDPGSSLSDFVTDSSIGHSIGNFWLLSELLQKAGRRPEIPYVSHLLVTQSKNTYMFLFHHIIFDMLSETYIRHS